MKERELIIKLGLALHWADVQSGQIVTSFDDLGEAGRQSYFKDATALLGSAPGFGVSIELVSDA